MESAWEDRKERERRRIAWGVTAVAAIAALPIRPLHELAVLAACIGWFVHLLDVHLTAVSERRAVSYATGWPLMGTAVVAGLLKQEFSLWVSVPLWAALAWLVWFAWRRDGRGPEA